jgi:hypothetical protein
MRVFLIGFFATAILCAVLAWLSGYNFDSRSKEVALGFLFSVAVSILGGCFAKTVEYS